MPKEVLNKNETPDKKEDGIDVWRGINIPEGMVRDAFPALALALLREFFISGDTKTMIFYGMLNNLEKMGHSENDIEEFKKGINECFKKFHKPNSFMG